MKYVAILTAAALGSAAFLVSGDALAQPGQRGSMFERLKAADTNADGLISRAEAQALPRLAAHFDRIDSNKDGQVSVDELRAARRHHKHGFALKRMDTDGDGRVSKAEALAFATARFERLDANHDGFITAEEAHAGKRGHRGAVTR